MYIFPTMLNGIEFKSDTHRKFAEALLLCNPNVTKMQQLIDISELINKIPDDKLKTLVFGDLPKYGINIGVY